MKSTIAIFACAWLLTACGSSTATTELTPSDQRFSAAFIRSMPGSASIEPHLDQLFMNQLQIATREHFTQGHGLIINYSYVDFNPGIRMARWLLPATGIGGASFKVRAIFQDPDGNTIGSMIADGTVTAGSFGGKEDVAVQNAANAIADYARTHFAIAH